MLKTSIAAIMALGSVLTTACSDNPMGVDAVSSGLAGADIGPSTGPSLGLSPGETFSFITIDDPAEASVSMTEGSTSQMLATLHYSLGGTLLGVPYANWRSSDNCVATVSSALPSWGLVTGVAAGTAHIIVESWGKSDTVSVTVAGPSAPSAACYENDWSWNYNDVSFTGTPRTPKKWSVGAGEKLVRVVLFAGPKPDYTILRGAKTTLKSEMWYDRGGKTGGKGYVVFSVTEGSVASVNNLGVVTGLNPGRTKVIARLGTLADTVPIYVR